MKRREYVTMTMEKSEWDDQVTYRDICEGKCIWKLRINHPNQKFYILECDSNPKDNPNYYACGRCIDFKYCPYCQKEIEVVW